MRHSTELARALGGADGTPARGFPTDSLST
jgi:hypothetical protein